MYLKKLDKYRCIALPYLKYPDFPNLPMIKHYVVKWNAI